jgi:nitronate monooxygenase
MTIGNYFIRRIRHGLRIDMIFSWKYIMKRLDNYTLRINGNDYKPLVIGAMGVDISTKALALAAADAGAIGHISDAMILVVADRNLGTRFVPEKLRRNHQHASSTDKSDVRFDADVVREAARLYAEDVMKDKTGSGAVFVNCMEKLTMNDGKTTLSARLNGLLDGGIDGITLSAGLHLNSFSLLRAHPRFEEAALGIIVSSARALKVFLSRARKAGRLPDYIVVEGPLAGGHLGFSMDELRARTLDACVTEVLDLLARERLDIPVIAAGGIFCGNDAMAMLALGASAVQVATRFTIAEESGLPYAVKQAYVRAEAEDIVVLNISPAGYPMRVLKQSPALGRAPRPNCEAFGYLLSNGHCAHIDDSANAGGERPPSAEHGIICLCTAMRNFQCWTCGANTHRLKETVQCLPNGDYALPCAREIIENYLYCTREPDVTFPVVDEQFLFHICCA